MDVILRDRAGDDFDVLGFADLSDEIPETLQPPVRKGLSFGIW
jgi:hypothetical protein